MADEFVKNIRFHGDLEVRDKMVALVDEVLKTGPAIEGDLDFSGGLKTLTETCIVRITDEDDSLTLVVEKQAGDSKPVRFVIYKETKLVYQPEAEADGEVNIDEDMDFLDDIE